MPEEKKVAKEIISRVDNIIKLNKSSFIDIKDILKGVETVKLCNLPKVSFIIKDNTRSYKIISKENKIFINQDDFIEIKDKLIFEYVEIYLQKNINDLFRTDNVKSIIINIPVPKSILLLKELVKKLNVDQIKVEQQIIKLEREINELVYGLYGLSKKELSIIEDSLKE